MAQMQKTALVKKSRKRFKKLFPQIRDQMEFYFSDANLQKDRFLKQKVQEAVDGYIDLELFLKFNKIRTLVSDVETIARALKKSEFLQINAEQTKVRRTTKITTPTDVDERTVYVECLPLGANHEWLKKVFSACGRVAYVSVPRYKSTGDIKGFAFVEFDSIEAAQKACKMMNNPPVSVAEKPGKFPKGKEERRLERQLEFRLGGNVRKRRASESQVDESATINPPPNKRRRTVSECRDSKLSTANKAKLDLNGEAENLSHHDESVESPDQNSSKDVTESSVEGSIKAIASLERKYEQKQRQKEKRPVEECENVEVYVKNKRRKPDLEVSFADNAVRTIDNDASGGHMHSKHIVNNSPEKEKSVICSEAKKFSETDSVNATKKKKKKKSKDKAKTEDIPELRVISKQDWIKLRTEYLALQKANMSELKKSLQALKPVRHTQHWQNSERQERPGDSSKSVENPPSKPSNPTTLVFTPGVIVRISSELPLNRKDLKSQLSSIGKVAYVDVLDGNTEAHIRCQDTTSASTIATASLPGCTCHLLTGDPEKQYWDKAAADKERKFGSDRSIKSKPKRRGRDKILQQAEKVQSFTDNGRKKHIVFDDD